MTARRLLPTGLLLGGLLLGACATDGPDPATTGRDPLAAADCDPLQRPRLQEGSHLLGDEAPPVPYSSSPPTSGWHASGRPLDPGTYLEEVSGPQQVRVLEQGGIVLSYDPSLPPDRVDALQRLPTEVERLVVTPYADADAPVVLTAWGVLQRCASVDATDVDAFREAHARAPGH